MAQNAETLSDEIAEYYDRGEEPGRLLAGTGLLERERTREILTRYLPAAPARIIDVGGGDGIHGRWLAEAGYEVHLIDPIAKHVEKAAATPSVTAEVGDARDLRLPDQSCDAALLIGPLYHLTKRTDRVQALCEARRVTRPGGRVFVAAISRFASALDGLLRGFLDDPAFAEIVRNDLRDGQHRNPTGRPGYFTTAYFHRPEELAEEIEDAGMAHERTLSVEGPAWLLQDFERHWEDAGRRERLLEVVRALEAEPSVLGAGAHLLATGRRPA